MAEQEQVETAPSETQPEETLDDVLKNVSIEQVAQSFDAKPSQPVQQQITQAPQLDIPDPTYDPDGFKRAIGKIAQNDFSTAQKVDQVLSLIQRREQEQERNREQTDIGNVVKEIETAVPVLKGKETLVQGLLGAYANKDPRITKVWQDRHKDPASWNKTLAVLKKQIAKEFDFAMDPQLAENIKAAKASRDQMATTNRPGPNEKWEERLRNASPTDFTKMWDQIKAGL